MQRRRSDGVRVARAGESSGYTDATYAAELNITDHTELGSNETIKQARTLSNRSARKRDGQVK